MMINSNCKHPEHLKEISVLQVHLFDINIPGDVSFRESDIFTAGDKITIVDTGLRSTTHSNLAVKLW